MSAIHERQWALEREREIREQARRNRENQVQELTESYLRRYEMIINDLENEGLMTYAADLINHAKSEIRRVRNLPAYEAREVSFMLGQFMRTLPREAREQRRIADEYQRMKAEEERLAQERAAQKLQAEKEAVWQEATNWKNKRARNLAFYALQDLKKQVFERNFSLDQITKEVDKIREQFEQQAVEQQQKFTKSVQAEVVEIQKAELIKQIETANLPQSQSERLKQQLANTKEEDLLQTAQQIHQAEDEQVENEEIRREMVKAVSQSLKQAGFNVLKPRLQKEGENDIVLVQANRPSGNSAKFRIHLNGSVRYEFDNYRGQRCKEDMQQVLPKLSEVYGVNLSDERVIWENPDDRLMDAKPITPLKTRTA